MSRGIEHLVRCRLESQNTRSERIDDCLKSHFVTNNRTKLKAHHALFPEHELASQVVLK